MMTHIKIGIITHYNDHQPGITIEITNPIVILVVMAS